MNNNSQELDSQGYTILKNAAPMELISSIQSYAQEFLKCEKNSSSIMEAMSQLEILDKKNSILFVLKWEKFYLQHKLLAFHLYSLWLKKY